MPKSLQLPIIAGGRLITTPSASLETIGANDFSVILNLFKDGDQMARMPGWVKFRPDTGTAVTNQYTFDATETALRFAELVRGDGTRALIGASLTKIKYYDTVTDAWVQIGSGFSSSGIPWQIEIIAGYAIFNNAVNLTQWWQIGDAAVTPLHELREAGIASVGRIAQYNGFLFVGDIVEIKAEQLAFWMNGYANYSLASTTAKAANFNVLTAENRTKYQVTTGAGTITATLPTLGLADHGNYWLLEKVDAGAGTVVTSPVVEGEALILTANTDLALLFWDGVRWIAKVFALGSVPALSAYGIPPTAITQHVADEQAWSELGKPINWAPLVVGVMLAASPTIKLPFLPFNWTVGKTRLAIIGGGADQGILGGQALYPDGILITANLGFNAAFGGHYITLEVTTNTSISYPRQIDVTRWSDISTFVGKQRMGNGQKITCMAELNGVLLVYQELGIFITRWTGQAKAPFALRQKYSGRAVPLFGDCVAAVRNSFHVYPSLENSFVQFDGLSDPTVHPLCELARDVFFTGLVPGDRCWSVVNPLLSMIWFVRPTKVFAFRYRADSPGCSEIDAVVNAAVIARAPGGSNDWFVMGIGRFVYQFAMVNDSVSSWLRDAVVPTAKLTSGLNAMRDQQHEKTLQTYIPLLASPSPDVAITVQLRGTYNPNGALSDLLSPAESLPTPAGDNLVACFFQANYFQDEIVLVDTRDLDFRISGRLFEFDVIGGLAVTRTG